ncbi:MAG: hypothetical protein WBQ32_07485 [Ignavibacteriaceae bacterium]
MKLKFKSKAMKAITIKYAAMFSIITSTAQMMISYLANLLNS